MSERAQIELIERRPVEIRVNVERCVGAHRRKRSNATEFLRNLIHDVISPLARAFGYKIAYDIYMECNIRDNKFYISSEYIKFEDEVWPFIRKQIEENPDIEFSPDLHYAKWQGAQLVVIVTENKSCARALIWLERA